MEIIGTINDSSLGYPMKELHSPAVRYWARWILCREDGKIALIHKSVKNEYKLPGWWVDEGELPEEAFLREIKEEVGYDAEIIRVLGIIEEHKWHENFKQISTVFEAKIISEYLGNKPTEKEKSEWLEVVWMDFDEAIVKVYESIDKIEASKYDNVYRSKFMVMRDYTILKFYKENYLWGK